LSGQKTHRFWNDEKLVNYQIISTTDLGPEKGVPLHETYSCTGGVRPWLLSHPDPRDTPNGSCGHLRQRRLPRRMCRTQWRRCCSQASTTPTDRHLRQWRLSRRMCRTKRGRCHTKIMNQGFARLPGRSPIPRCSGEAGRSASATRFRAFASDAGLCRIRIALFGHPRHKFGRVDASSHCQKSSFLVRLCKELNDMRDVLTAASR
jgi:hypothetical protein